MTKEFNDDIQLYEFLNRFFDMDNMEAINEFSSDNECFQKEEQYEGCFPNDIPLEYLYMLDCLNEELGENLVHRNASESLYNGGNLYPNCQISIACGYDKLELYMNDDQKPLCSISMAEFNYENFNSASMEVKEFEIPDFDKLVNLCQKSILDFPKVYQDLRQGTYNKEKYLTKESPLQQKDAELSELEAEARGYDEAEALIDRQNEGQSIGE